jgi:hypothetical protein
MSGRERHSALERMLPRRRLPEELVARIDEALATARASEAAVMTVGAACFDAAEQASRAAQLAERASAMLAERVAAVPLAPGGVVPPGPVSHVDPSLRRFCARADRVAARLRELERPRAVATAV